MKRCTKCGRELDESCFSKRKDTKDGLSYVCRDCKREYDKQFRKKEIQQIEEKGKIEKEDKNVIIGNDYKILICEKCGKPFKVGRKSDGKNFLVRKYCSECSSIKTRKCVKCGSEFIVERAKDGRHFKNTKLCENCRKKPETKTIICEKCGKPFTVDKYPGTDSFKKIRFCSPQCASSITELKDGKIVFKEKYSTCKYCGKPIKAKLTDNFQYSMRTVCDDCLKPKEKPEHIKRICSICGKEFEVGLTPCGNYSSTQYCSDECFLEGFKTKCIKTCREKYGVDYPCLTDNALEKGNIISNINKKFAKFLDEHNIIYQMEFVLGHYSYDFKELATN